MIKIKTIGSINIFKREGASFKYVTFSSLGQKTGEFKNLRKAVKYAESVNNFNLYGSTHADECADGFVFAKHPEW